MTILENKVNMPRQSYDVLRDLSSHLNCYHELYFRVFLLKQTTQTTKRIRKTLLAACPAIPDDSPPLLPYCRS